MASKDLGQEGKNLGMVPIKGNRGKLDLNPQVLRGGKRASGRSISDKGGSEIGGVEAYPEVLRGCLLKLQGGSKKGSIV